MRQLFNQLMGKKPTMLTPAQMAMEELISGAKEAQAERAAQPVAPPDTSGLINTINQRGGGTASADVFDIGGQTAPSGALGGDIGGMGSMMSGALGGLSGGIDGVMADAQKNVDLRIKDNLDPRNPMRENTLARVRSGQAVPMRGLRYGGYVAPGEEVLVGEVAPEKVIARPEGGVEVVPLDAPQAMADDPFTAQERGMMDAPRMSNPERNIGAYDGVGYDPNAHGGNPYGDGSQRTMGNEPVSGISDITIDEGSAPPPRRSLLDTKRIIARNNDGLVDEGVWNAREDVLKEDQWRALNEPVKKSKWKDIGMMLLTSLNNQVNNRQDPVRTWGEIKRDEKVGALAPQLQVLQQRRAEKEAQAKAKMQRDLEAARIQDYKDDAEYNRRRAANMDAETERKANDTVVRERTNRMNTVSRMLKDLPEFIPGDPKFSAIEEALGDVGLPITQKDAKKKVDLKQDQRTGAWTVILTNPATGQQEVRDVMKGGKVLTTTPTVVMQGELGLLKQNDQQVFQADQNAQTRSLRLKIQENAQKFGREKTTQMATDAFKRQFNAQNGRPPSQTEIDAYLNAVIYPEMQATGEAIPDQP